MLMALSRSAGVDVTDLGVWPDDAGEIEKRLAKAPVQCEQNNIRALARVHTDPGWSAERHHVQTLYQDRCTMSRAPPSVTSHLLALIGVAQQQLGYSGMITRRSVTLADALTLTAVGGYPLMAGYGTLVLAGILAGRAQHSVFS